MALWNKNPDNTQTLSDIIRGMQYSINAANEILEMNFIETLEKYFDKDGVPLSKKIQIGTNEINVPIISLITPNPLFIDELEIDLKAKINETAIKKINDETKKSLNNGTSNNIDNTNRSSFIVDVTPSSREDKNLTSIRIKFKQGITPEGYSRILDVLHKSFGS